MGDSSDNLEWLREKAERIYGEHNKRATLPEDRIRVKEIKILKTILLNHNTGVQHIRLAKEAGLDRKNLTPYTHRLIERKLIRRESGRQGKYFPTEEAYNDARLSAELFGINIRLKLLRKNDLVTTNKKIDLIAPNWVSLNSSRYKHYFVPKFREDDKLEHAIFEFSNKIGDFYNIYYN